MVHPLDALIHTVALTPLSLVDNAEQAKFADATEAGALDLRIAKLEKVIGGGDLSRAAAELGDIDLNISSAITNIAERAAILEAESTAAMTARLSALLTLKGQAEATKKTDGKPATEEVSASAPMPIAGTFSWESVHLSKSDLSHHFREMTRASHSVASRSPSRRCSTSSGSTRFTARCRSGTRPHRRCPN